MFRCALRRGIIGFTAGIAVDYIVAMVVSFVLKLGYFMPCLASLPEKVGGEMNAVVLQAMIFGIIGAAIGVVPVFFKMSKVKGAKRYIASVLTVIAFVLLVGMSAMYMT